MAKVGQIIRAAREMAGLSLKDLSHKAGVDKNTIHYTEVGKSAPRGATIWALCRALGYASLEDMAVSVGAVSGPPRLRAHAGEPDGIPVFNEIPAGSGDFDPTELGDDNGLAERTIPRWLIGVDDPTAFGAVVRGDSMAPKYREGDIIICSPRAAHASGMVAAFRLDNGDCGVKIVIDLGDGRLELRPLNDRHDVRIVQRDAVTRLARVVGRFERLGE